MRHASPAARRRGGFTLLELICATGIMAMLALSLYTAMRIGFKARDRALAAVGPARSAEVAMDMVRRDLESALPPRGVLAGVFYGVPGLESPGTSAVQFYAVAPPPLLASDPTAPGYGTGARRSGSSAAPSSMDRVDPTAYGGVQRVELLVRAGPPGGAGAAEGELVRRTTRNLLAPTEPVPDEEVLCRGVTAFTIRYYDGTQWYDEWDSTQYGDTIPMAVEVALELTRPQDPTRAAETFGNAADPTNTAAYRTSRVFFLPCRDETTLLEGGTQ